MGSESRKKRALSPNFCEICGFDVVIQRHRIVPGRVGGKYVKANVISLCPNDHALADRGDYEPEYLQEIVRKRIEEESLEQTNQTDDSQPIQGD